MGNGNRGLGAEHFERLEGRQLLSSSSLSSGLLTITGNSSTANDLGAYVSGSNIVASYNGTTKSYASSSVTKISIVGGSANDSVWIKPEVTKPSTIKGNGGNDTLSGGAGKDTIYGGSGNDLIYGNDNADSLKGEDGEDTLYGGAGSDYLDGGNGNDVKYDEQYAGGVSSDVPITPPPTDGGGSTPSGDTSATAPSPVITTRGTSIMAGQAIFVHGVSSSLGSGSPQNALYKWDFGDSGSDYNTLNGFNASHFYANAGTYKVTLTLTNQAGKTNSTSVTITVSSNTRKKVYVSNNGSDSNSGTQSSPLKTWGKAASLYSSTSNVEVLFERGDTFDASTVFNVNGDNVVVGAYGSGNKPIIRWTANVSGYPSIVSPGGDSVTIRDLSFTSSTSNVPQAIHPSGNNLTILNNDFHKQGYAINANGRPDGLLVQGNSSPDISGIKSYFIWGEGTDHAYLDNTVANSNEEHVIRVVSADRVLIWDNNLTNTTGDVSGDDTPKGTLTLHKGSYYWVAKNHLNDGPAAIGPLGNGDGLSDTAGRFRYGVFDGNVLDTKMYVDHGAEHIMVRNNVIKSADTALLVEGYNSQYSRTTVDVAILNNTFINNASTGRAVEVEKDASSVTLANNLYVAPNLTTGSGSSASVYVEDSDLSEFKLIDNNVWANATASLWAQGGQNYVYPSWSNQSGYKSATEWNAMSPVGTDVFSDVSVSSSYAPTSSTVVNDTAEYVMGVFFDMNGKTRSNWTAGAVEL